MLLSLTYPATDTASGKRPHGKTASAGPETTGFSTRPEQFRRQTPARRQAGYTAPASHHCPALLPQNKTSSATHTEWLHAHARDIRQAYTAQSGRQSG